MRILIRNLVLGAFALAMSSHAIAGGPIAQCAPGQAFVWGGGGVNIPYNPDMGDLVTAGDNAAAVALVALLMFPLWRFAVQKCSPAGVAVASLPPVSLGIGLLGLSAVVVFTDYYLSAVSLVLLIPSQWFFGLIFYGVIVYLLDKSLRVGLDEMLKLLSGGK